MLKELSVKDEAFPYFESYVMNCAKHNQYHFRVEDASKEHRMISVNGAQLFSDMFSNRLVELRNGMLRYKS